MVMETLKKRDKKGLSVMIGYVLLVVFALAISVGIYQWLKTFVPQDSLDCPDGVSVFLKSANFNGTSNKLTIEVVNSGRFNIAGYFIHVATVSADEVPNVDVSSYLNKTESSAGIHAGSVIFLIGSDENNPFSPGDSEMHSFDLLELTGTPKIVSVIPTRQQVDDDRKRFVGCGTARAEQNVEYFA
ncbi:MAG: hypothetical protein KKC96_03015 [Nanoarchaeota archaeon]|nr:hypothetical protein [Nanoarchaeota archaeon]